MSVAVEAKPQLFGWRVDAPPTELIDLATNAPGIGVVGMVETQAHDTRLMGVAAGIAHTHEDTVQLACDLLATPDNAVTPLGHVSRYMFKAVGIGYEPGQVLPLTGMTVEASLPLHDYDGTPFYGANGNELHWLEVGMNTGERLTMAKQNTDVLARQVAHIRDLESNRQKYHLETAEEMVRFAREHNPTMQHLSLVRITPANRDKYATQIKALYEEAFTDYPGNPFAEVMENCASNFYLVAVAEMETSGGLQSQVVSITGLELLQPIEGIRVGEMGGSASLKMAPGLGPLMKRAEFGRVIEARVSPHLWYTESRIGKTLASSIRAGLTHIDSRIILPWHSHIGSDKDVGVGGRRIAVTGKGGKAVGLESMTMTWASHAELAQVLEQYGDIPYIGIREENDGIYYQVW